MKISSCTGVYFCKSTNGHNATLEFSELVSHTKSLEMVPVVWYYSDVSLSDLNRFTSAIKEKKINRIIIAGIQASLEISDSGNKVFLVEKTGTIGGHMAMFNKTFSTLDYAACILTSKMVQVGQHPNI